MDLPGPPSIFIKNNITLKDISPYIFTITRDLNRVREGSPSLSSWGSQGDSIVLTHLSYQHSLSITLPCSTVTSAVPMCCWQCHWQRGLSMSASRINARSCQSLWNLMEHEDNDGLKVMLCSIVHAECWVNLGHILSVVPEEFLHTQSFSSFSQISLPIFSFTKELKTNSNWFLFLRDRC